MYKVTVEDTFYAEHAVKMPGGEIEPSHGHDWRVRVCAAARELDEYGFAFEFKDFRKALNIVISNIGQNLNELELNGQHPTTELVCKHFYDKMQQELSSVELDYVEIEEEKGCLVRYSRD
ncbi:queuosine biosynthesis protein QueD [Sedimentisphaera cyanobacteriorum]|uniref:6-carboxy-5,6,7,8-tetrahydropterin synthase n=1 Tax=Sedimentisphaera cyanobacteriorum TaxID=1940790 RepID=A0A1Q2HPF8_9BACT|nr:6-carboxytetrahydropterin synthase [Sedimentisphaera cyanobacteriorum]AQQ09349.1 queuosine biosynthesis protein QueD [Sedimentisphaera cyanobacteriorum]